MLFNNRPGGTGICNKKIELLSQKSIKEISGIEPDISEMGEIAGQNFIPFYQPKYNIKSGRIDGTEALARWSRDGGSILQPDSFIPSFEKCGFTVDIDYYILEKTCRNIQRRIQSQKRVVPASCNFSRLHTGNKNFPDKVMSVVREYGIPQCYIDIEFTETMRLENIEILYNQFRRFHELGFRVVIDDFGAGYSSLRLLQYPDIDIIKLDRSLLGTGKTTSREKFVLSSVITLAHQLGLSVVCEGVETEDHVRLLREAGCETGQGCFYSKPLSAQQFEELLDHTA